MGPTWSEAQRHGRHGFGGGWGLNSETLCSATGHTREKSGTSEEVSAHRAAKALAIFFFRQQ